MTDAADLPSFRLDPINLCVWRTAARGEAERVKLTPKTFDVLRYLVEHAGRLVTHEELLHAVWRDVDVQQEVLKSHVLAIRNALGDGTGGRSFIETHRGRGYRFVGAIAHPDPDAAGASPADVAMRIDGFAGRVAPLHQLLDAFARAATGEPQAIFVSGEPGIGKTTLIAQFLDRVRERASPRVAQGHCIEGFAGAEPYYPLLEAFGALCRGAGGADIVRTLVARAPAWAMQMPAQVPEEHRASIQPQLLEGARGRMVREATNLVDALAATRPFVLVLEDLHWADYATVDFLSAICRRRSAAKLMLIATYRPDDLGRHPLKQMVHDLAAHRYCTGIELGPLSDAAIADVLQGRPDGEPADTTLVRFARERCGGNPLFLRITLDYLAERGVVERFAHGWRLAAPLDGSAQETPPTLARLIESRLDRMNGEQLNVLEAASVAGARFDPASVALAAGVSVPTFEAVCEQLARGTGIVRRDELLTLPDHALVRTYAFNHDVYRQVLYDRIGETRRAQLHRAIGERLEALYPPAQRDEVAVRLAQHFAAARDWSHALDYLRSALTVASNRFAYRDALAIVARAAEVASRLPDAVRAPVEIEWLERRASIEAAGHDSDAMASYRELAAKAQRSGDVDAQIRALLGLAYALSWHDLGASLRALDEVLAMCDRQRDRIARDFTRLTAYVRRIWGAGWNHDDARKCEAAFARLRAHAEPHGVARAELQFSMLCMVSTRYREAHDLVSASYRMLHASPRSLLELDLARVAWMHHIGVPWSLFSLGEFGAAFDAFDASTAAFEQNGDPSVVHSLRIYRGVLLFHALDYEGVLLECGTAARAAMQPDAAGASSGDRVLPVERRISLIFCGLAEAGLGNHATALDYLLEAQRQMDSRPVHLDWYWRLAMEWGRVHVHLADSDSAAALRRAERLTGLAAATDERMWHALAWEARARAALMAGATGDAVACAAKALVACAAAPVPLAEWRVHAVAAAAFDAAGESAKALAHAGLCAAARQRLAETMPPGHPSRLAFERRSGTVAACA